MKSMSNFLLSPLFLSMLQNLEGMEQGASSSNNTEDINQNFQNLLLMLTGDSENTSSSTGSLFSSLTGDLNESLFSLQLQNEDPSAQTPFSLFAKKYSTTFGVENSTHINQFDAERQIGGNGANSDCGPTSLVMSLHQLGLGVAGETASCSSGDAVCLARRSMASSSAKDGVDANGNWSDAEHNTYTDFSDLSRGASAAGAIPTRISPSASGIINALNSGAKVIVSGTFAGKSPLPWTGDRGVDNQSAPGHATAHIINVSGFDPLTQKFTIHDPARNTPNQVTAAQLQSFMSGNAGALAIRRA